MRSSRYARQVIFPPFGPEGQERLRNARILIVGCGALGTHSAEHLARAGAGFIRLVDRDIVEWSNLQRQAGFDESHAEKGALKAEALAERLSRVNSEITIEPRAVDFNFTNALELAAGSTLLLDGSDNLPARFLLNDVSYKTRVPWIYAGAIGGEGHVQLFSGTEGPCLRCQMPELPPPGAVLTCDTGGVLGPSAAVAAAWQAGLALRSIAQGYAPDLAGRKAMLSPWEQSARVVSFSADPACPVCAKHRFDALSGAGAERAVPLCGRNAVQVRPANPEGGRLDLAETARRLRGLGSVELRGNVLRMVAPDGYTLTLFEDGRAIFDGLTDPDRARSLYARMVGQ